MNRTQADRWCERGILGLVLAILVFAPLAMGAVRPFEFLVVQALTIGVGAVWLLRLWLSPDSKIFWPPISWAVSAFVLYAVWQYVNADIEYAARQELIRVLIYAFLFFAIINNVGKAESAQVISVVLIVLACALASYGLFQFMTKGTHVWTYLRPLQYYTRGSGTFINPNHFSGFLEMILPLGIAYTLLGRLNHVFKIFLGYATCVILAGIAVSLSRGGWIATALLLIGIPVLLLTQRSFRLKAVFLIGIAVCAIVIFLNTSWFQQRMQASHGNLGQFFDQRPLFWKSAIHMWKENPWTGAGPGHFDYRYGQFRAEDLEAQFRPQYVHNDYLNALADWGTVGSGIILAALILLAVGVVRTWKQIKTGQNDIGKKRSNRQALVVGAGFGVVVILLHSVVDFNLQIPSNAIVFVTLMALLTGFRRYEAESFFRSLRLPGKIGFTAVLLIPMLYLSVQGTKKFYEQRWIAKSEKLTDQPVAQVAALKEAYAVEPMNFETTYMIGELIRLQSFTGDGPYREQALEAMRWFVRGMDLNRYSAYNFLRHGMCLDWLGEHEKAFAFFEKSIQLEPNSYYFATYMGWHFMQTEDYVSAKKWFERSLGLYNNYMNRNPRPAIYLQIIERRLAESSAPAELIIPPKP